MDWLLDLLGLNKGKATQEAAAQNRGVIGGLDKKLGGIIDTTDAAQKGFLGNSLDLASMGPNAEGILGDIYGLNGPEGAAKARGMFQAGPGYQFQMDQGLDALDRRAASRGMLQSGNTNLDTLGFSQGLADQSWNNWINGITGGIDRQIGTLGDLATQAGQTGATRMGTAGDIASGYLNTNNQTAAGKEAGQGAIWDLLGNVAGVAGSAFGLGGAFGQGGAFGKPMPKGLGYGGGF